MKMNNNLTIHMTPIGVVRSCFKERFGTPRQSDLVPSSEAWIELDASVQPEFSLSGLEGFSHLWVVFHFHKNTNQKFTAKVHPPRMNGESVGVYATRSPHRPNSIGLSLVEIRGVEKHRIKIGSHDLIEGTPVLDLKPYLKDSESKPDATSGWSQDKTYNAKLSVAWDPSATDFVLGNIPEAEKFFQLVEQTLQLDPRPLVYKGEKSNASDRHAVRFLDWDVHFKYPSSDKIHIVEVKLWLI